MPGPDPAGVHRARVVRRAGGHPRRGHEPGGAAGRGGRRHRRQPGLPVRHRLPCPHRARPAAPGGVARRARLRRGRLVGGADRRGPRRPGHRGGRGRPGSRPGPRARGRARNSFRNEHRSGPRHPRRDRGRGARVPRRARLGRHTGQRGAGPAPPRAARPGRTAAGRGGHAAGADGPGHRAGAGDLRLPRDGGPGLPADAGPGRGRHAAPRAARRRGHRPGAGRCGPGRPGRPLVQGRDYRDRARRLTPAATARS